MEAPSGPETDQPRPDAILRMYAVGSFLNTGFFMMLYGFGMLSMAAVRNMPFDEFEELFLQQLQAISDPDVASGAEAMLHIFHESGVLLLGIFFLRTVLRFTGVLLMWRGRRQGFHFYAFAQLAGIFAPHLVLPWHYLGLWGPLAAVGMTALYGAQVKYLPR